MSIHTADLIVVVLIIATVPAANLFWLLYTFTSPWWRSLPGRALWVKSLSTMLLIDLALAVRVLQVGEEWLAITRVAVIGLICIGVNLMFSALLYEKTPIFRDWLQQRRCDAAQR